MRKINILFFVVVLVIIVIVVFLSGNKEANTPNTISQEETEVTERNYDMVPSFDFERFNGGRMTEEDLTAKISVMTIWATWCPFCVDELPDFGVLKENFPDDIEIIAVNRQESLEKVQNYFDREGIFLTDKITFLQDPQDTFARDIGRISMPETIFVNQNGEILFHKRGPMGIDEMTDITRELLAEI